MQQHIEICKKFAIPHTIKEIKVLGNGLINSTYKITCETSDTEYVLQNINHNVFKNIDKLQQNFKKISEHIYQKLIDNNETDIERKVLRIIPTLDNQLFYFDGNNYWRMSYLIPDSFTFEQITAKSAKAAGTAFGKFQLMLSDITSKY